MRLHHLLPIGRAFATTPERSRYRPAEEGMVPDFSTPAGSGRAVEWGREPAPGTEVATSSVEGESGAAVAASPAVGFGLGRGRRPVRAGRGWRFPRWFEQVVLALLRPGNRRRGTRPVQGEFPLGAVKVARNDLVTSDLEVVEVRPAKLSAACRTRLLRLWWDQGAKRLRGLGGVLH